MNDNRKAQLIKDDFSNISHIANGAAMYQMKNCCPTQMMGYLIRTAEGYLIAIDGGNREDTETFLNLARSVLDCRDGDKPRIDAWFLTHVHSDHVGVFMETIANYRDRVDIGAVYYNFPSVEYQDKYESIYAYTSHEFHEIEPLFFDIAVKVHTGDSYSFGTAVFDIMTEPDESITVNTGNNNSVAIMVRIEEQRVFFLGDMGIEEGEAMLCHYQPEDLRADFVEMAHHGQNGVTFEVYRTISPKACLWCAPDWLWRNDAGEGYGTGTWKTLVTRCWMQDLGLKHHFVEKDGIWEIPLPYKF